jgi:hypothetical protein
MISADRVAHDELVKRQGPPAQALVGVGVLFREAGHDRRHLFTGFGHFDARLQATHDVEIPGAAALRAEDVVVGKRRPDLDAFGIREPFGKDSHHFEQLTLESDLLSEHRRIAPEAVLPQIVTDDRDLGVRRLVVVGPETAALDGDDLEHVEERAADLDRAQAMEEA